MAKYIDKDLAMQSFENAMPDGDIFDAIDQLPTVEVVRCKDCKYGMPVKNGFSDDMIACENKDSPCGYSPLLCQFDWFCGDGERREVSDG